MYLIDMEKDEFISYFDLEHIDENYIAECNENKFGIGIVYKNVIQAKRII